MAKQMLEAACSGPQYGGGLGGQRPGRRSPMRRSDCRNELNRPANHAYGRRRRLASRSRILIPV